MKEKEVKILPCAPKGIKFGFGELSPTIEELTVEQAEVIAAQYPGQYVTVVEKKSVSAASLPDAQTK